MQMYIKFVMLYATFLALYQAFYNSTNTECSHWDQSLDEGYGGWSTENCSLGSPHSAVMVTSSSGW